MNYYNPYFYSIPEMTNTARTGLFSRLFGGLTFGRFIDGTQRALNFANQAIPFVKQVKPMIGNAKTMLKVMNEFKRSEKNNSYKPNDINNKKSNIVNESIKEKSTINDDQGPTFFM